MVDRVYSAVQMNCKIFTKALLLFTFASCSSTTQSNKDILDRSYSNMVGDIEYDEVIDNINFEPCKEDSTSLHYYNLQGIHEILAPIKRKIRKLYEIPENSYNQNGFLTVRFLVNCKGDMGRFRVIGIDNEFEKYEFNEKISDQLIEIIKNLNDWEKLEGYDTDYYQHLTFKFEAGKIRNITP